METGKILEVNNIKVHFPIKRSLHQCLMRKPAKYIRAVDGVSFGVDREETLGIVGESGCGKTTIGKALVRLNTVTSGKILYNGKDITRITASENKEYCKKIQFIFQDPYSSLNPKMTHIGYS